MTTTTNSAVKTKTNEQTAASVQAEISKGALTSLGVTGAVILLLSCVTLASALMFTGGPVSLAKSWFSAIIGM